MNPIKDTFLRLFRMSQKKPILKAYAKKCLKCDRTFKEGDHYIGLAYEGFIRSTHENIYEITEYIFSKDHGIKSHSICFDCLNRFSESKTISYDEYDFIKTPPDFLKDH